jgi:hypothetical protein
MAEDPVLRIMVVPPGCTRAQGDEALLAGVTPVNEHSASDLLDELTRHPDADPCDQWGDDGGSWRHPDLVAPSFRTDT